MSTPLEGGYLCGAVRYRVTARPLDSAYCRCRMCQKNSGAPLQASASSRSAAFAIIRGEPKAYRTSAMGVRHFRPDCGSQLTFRPAVDQPYVSVNLPTLDRPEALEPRMHIWRESRIPWFESADDLPRHDHGGPQVGG